MKQGSRARSAGWIAAAAAIAFSFAPVSSFAACTFGANQYTPVLDTASGLLKYCSGTTTTNATIAASGVAAGGSTTQVLYNSAGVTTGSANFTWNGSNALTVVGTINATTFSGNVTGNLTGNADTATALQTARNFSLTGDATAAAISFNGTGAVALATTVAKINGATLGATTATAGNLLIGSGTQWVSNAVTGDVTIGSTGVTAIGANKVTRAMAAQGIARSVIGVAGNATANVTDIQGTANQVLRVDSAGTGLAFGAVNLASSAAVTGNLPVANLNSGTSASSSTFWRGDGTWAAPTFSTNTIGQLDSNVTVTDAGTGSIAMNVDGVMRFQADGTNGRVVVGAQNGTTEGGEIFLSGAGSNGGFIFDNVSGYARLFQNDASTYTDQIFNAGAGVTNLAVEGGVRVGGTGAPLAQFEVQKDQNALTYSDLYNVNTGSSAGSIFRLITSDVAGTGTTAADFVKYKTGALNILNNETNVAGKLSLGTSAAVRMTIDTSGNVGIGTTSPGVLLDIVKNQNALTEARVYNNNAGAAAQARLSIATGTANAYVISQIDDNAGAPYYQLTAGGGITNAYYQMPTHIFRNVVGTEWMRIASTGNVGIGTSSPSAKLHVVGKIYGDTDGTGAGYTNALGVTRNAGDDGIRYTQHNVGAIWMGHSTVGIIGTDAQDITFKTGISSTGAIGTTGTERLRITTTGNVGIGTASPAAKLDVSGNANITGNLTVTGAITGSLTQKFANDTWLQSADNKNRFFFGANGTTYYGSQSGYVWRNAADNVDRLYLGDAGDLYLRGNIFRIGDNATAGGGSWGELDLKSGASADNRLWNMAAAADSNMYWRACNDARSSCPTVMTLQRGGSLTTAGEITSTAGNQFRMVGGNYGGFFRQDGTNTYFLLTASGNQYGTYNTLRPLRINNATGDAYFADSAVSIAHASGNLTTSGTLTVTNSAVSRIGGNNIQNDSIEMTQNVSGNRWSYVDFHGDDTYTDYGLRLARSNGGVNGDSGLWHRGTGNLYISAQDAGWIHMQTASADRLNIDPAGKIGVGTSLLTGAFTVSSAAWPTILSQNPSGWATIAMKGNYNSSLVMHYGDSSANELRFGRYAADMTTWQANPVTINMGAPDGSVYLNGSGDITLRNVYATNYYISSDARLKHDITPFAHEGLDVVGALRAVHFKWNKDDTSDIGVIAQEVERVLPGAVSTKPDGFKAVAYDKLVLPVIEAVKELHAIVTQLEAANDNLAKDNANLQRELKELERRLERLEQGRNKPDQHSSNVITFRRAA